MREVALAAGRPPTAYGQGRAEAEQSRGIFPRVDRERRVTRDRRRQDPESSAIVPVTPLVFFFANPLVPESADHTVPGTMLERSVHSGH
jgi:hypothetical protein